MGRVDKPNRPRHINDALWAVANASLNPEVEAGERYVQAFTQRWGGLELDSLMRAETGTELVEGIDRLFVLFALGHTRTAEAQRRLAQLLESQRPDDRWASAICLSEMQDHRALPELCSLMTDYLPERLEEYLRPPLTLYEGMRWGLPMKIEEYRDSAAVPALHRTLERLIRLLDQAAIPAADMAVLARARSDPKSLTQEDMAHVEAVFKPRAQALVDRLQTAATNGEDGPGENTASAPGAGTRADPATSQAILDNLIGYEDDVVYALGRLNASGALTGLRAATPFLHVWVVHLLLAQLHDAYKRSDVTPALSPPLIADLRTGMTFTFGLDSQEQDQALELYRLSTKVYRIRMRYSRERIMPAHDTSGTASGAGSTSSV